MPVPILLMTRALDLGGSERQTAEMARALDPAEFTVYVACFRAGGLRDAELRAQGVPVTSLGVSSFLGPSLLTGAFALARLLRQHAIQLVHSFDVPSNLFAVPAARLFRTPRVVSSQRAFRSLTPGLRHTLLRLTDRMVDAVVVNSEAVRRDLVDRDGVPSQRIHICYNGVDMSVFRRTAARRTGGLVIGTVCALRPEKNLETLLDAFARLDAGFGARLVIVGDGPSKAALLQRASALGLEGRFVLEPSAPDVPVRLGGIDIFVLPSLTESCSNSLIEAMACECCVVASAVGGNPEVVTTGETGLLFEARDNESLRQALDTLIRSEEQRRRLATAAAESARARFSIGRAAARMAEIYRHVLTAPAAGAALPGAR